MMSIESIRKCTIEELERIINWDAADRFVDSADSCDYYTIEMAAEDLACAGDTESDPERYAEQMNIYIAWAKKSSGVEE